jgi:hypothetical protein
MSEQTKDTTETAASDTPAQRAARLVDRGIRLRALGQREAALEAYREAVEAYRALATENSDAFLPDLAVGPILPEHDHRPAEPAVVVAMFAMPRRRQRWPTARSPRCPANIFAPANVEGVEGSWRSRVRVDDPTS